MKKIIAICLLFAILLCNQSVFAADTVDNISVTSGCSTIDGQVPFLGSQPVLKNGKSFILYEANTDSLMYSYNADESLPPSSLLKILAALIAIEKGNMTDVVTVKGEVLETLDKDAAVIKLVADEVVTVQDLLYGMMVGSGNDAAVILADHILGSQDAFVAELNRYAAELGCTATNFTNVHGLHDDNQYTTARDVCRIVAKAIQNEQFCEVFGAKYYSIPETNKSEARHLSSQNYLMNNDSVAAYFDERVIGSRTGVANDRTRNIASVAQVNDMKLICIVMGAESKFEDDGYSVKVYGGYDETTKLLDLGFNGYKTAQILHDNQIVIQKSVIDGSSEVSLGTYTGAYAVVPDNMNENSLSYRYIDEASLTAPIEKGQKLSTLQIWCGSVCLAQRDLVAFNDVFLAGTVFSDNAEANRDFGFIKIVTYVLIALGIVAVLFVAALYILRTVRIAKARRQSRRNSRNRRRSR